MWRTFIKVLTVRSSLLITAYILSLGISYFILSTASTGQCQSVQWHSHATATQHPLMGEQVLDRVQWSRAERAAMIYLTNWPVLTPPARGRGTQPFVKCVCVCVCVCLCVCVRACEPVDPKTPQGLRLIWEIPE